MSYKDRVPFEILLGETLVGIDGGEDDEVMRFFTAKGEQFYMFHEQDCCESVYVEDICGDLGDVIGSPILLAEEVESGENPDDIDTTDYYQDSFTWTFYKLSTVKGSVTIRWYGCSNGYYCERVDFERVV